MDAMVWVVWLIVGALIGWLINPILETNRCCGLPACIFSGIIGAVLGGATLFLLVDPNGADRTLNGWSIVTAYIGAVIVVGGVYVFGAERRRIF